VDITELEIQAMAVDQADAIYVANVTQGILKSTDLGQTWTLLDFPARASLSTNPQLVLASDGTLLAGMGAVVERSEDAGQSWQHLPGVPPAFTVVSLAASPVFSSDGIVLAGGDYASRQIVRSSDRGETWQVVMDAASVESAADVAAIAFSPRFEQDQTVIAWLQYGGLLISTDGGVNWGLAPGNLDEYYAQSLVIGPDGKQIFVGALDGTLLVSDDLGQSWETLGSRIPDDRVWTKSLAFGDSGTMFVGTDVGVYRSTDAGRQVWNAANQGLPLDPSTGMPVPILNLAFSKDRLFAGLAQGGVYYSEDEGRSWVSTLTGEPASPTQASATPTPVVPDTPTPEVSPTPTSAAATPEAVDCPVKPAYYVDVWSQHMSDLGCPVASGVFPAAVQTFEGGWMFWRSDVQIIYVLPENAPFSRYNDTWDAAQPAYSCPTLFPSQTPPTPQRGFGKVWCEQTLLRDLLGNATSEEKLFEGTFQEFDNGLIFEDDQGSTYVLETRLNGWQTVK
jgi:photosystem II stability/assembly factor-like uncharacterized protein